MTGDRLLHSGAVIGRIDGRFRNHLVDHHTTRKKNGEEAHGAKFVADTIELDHVGELPAL